MWGVGSRTSYVLDVSTLDIGGSKGGGVDEISDVIRGGGGGRVAILVNFGLGGVVKNSEFFWMSYINDPKFE